MSTNAKLCQSCGRHAANCILCGKPFAKKMAYLCNRCGFGLKGDQCVKCGKPFAKIQANLCPACAAKYNNKCIKCGR